MTECNIRYLATPRYGFSNNESFMSESIPSRSLTMIIAGFGECSYEGLYLGFSSFALKE